MDNPPDARAITPAIGPDERRASELPEEQREEIVRDVLPAEEVIKANVTSENIIVGDDGSVRLDEFGARYLAAQELDDQIDGADIESGDVVETDDGFRPGAEIRRELAAAELDQQIEGRDITTEDVVLRDDGFSPDEEIRRAEAAEEFDAQLDDVEVANDDLVERVVTDEEAAQRDGVEAGDEVFLPSQDIVAEQQAFDAADQLDEEFSGPNLPDVVSSGVVDFAQGEFEGDVELPDVDIGGGDIEVVDGAVRLTEGTQSEIQRAELAASLDVRTGRDITREDFVETGDGVTPGEDAQAAQEELLRDELAQEIDTDTQTDISGDDIVLDRDGDEVSASLSREAQEAEAVASLVEQLNEQDANPAAYENIVTEESDGGIVARVDFDGPDTDIEPPEFSSEFGGDDIVGTETVDPVFGGAGIDNGGGILDAAAAFEDEVADLPGVDAATDVVGGAGETAVDAGSGLADLTSPITSPVVGASEDARDFLVEDSIQPAFRALNNVDTPDAVDNTVGQVPGATNAARFTSSGLEGLATGFTDLTVGAPALAADAVDASTDAAVFAGEQISSEGVVEGTETLPIPAEMSLVQHRLLQLNGSGPTLRVWEGHLLAWLSPDTWLAGQRRSRDGRQATLVNGRRQQLGTTDWLRAPDNKPKSVRSAGWESETEAGSAAAGMTFLIWSSPIHNPSGTLIDRRRPRAVVVAMGERPRAQLRPVVPPGSRFARRSCRRATCGHSFAARMFRARASART
ncbi:hypothetical protein [Halovenus salina]|uniref:Uncharacterized protein n=1 Tax=Halovenus salina TaxID=1510225 RepID=A0ABD5W808_9EURY